MVAPTQKPTLPPGVSEPSDSARTRIPPFWDWYTNWEQARETGEGRHWKEFLMVPLTRWLNQRLCDGQAEESVAGPFGLGARCFCELELNQGTLTWAFEPDLESRPFRVAVRRFDLPSDEGEFPAGSIGQRNGLHYPLSKHEGLPTLGWLWDNCRIEEDNEHE